MSSHSRLLWRCRRGTREMDTLFGRFVELEYDSLSADQQIVFERFLDEQDPDIYAWILGHSHPDKLEYRFLIERLQAIHLS